MSEYFAELFIFFTDSCKGADNAQCKQKNQESLTRIHEDAFPECTNPKTHTYTHFRILINPGPIPDSWKTRLMLVTSILPITITLTVNCVLKSRDSYASYIVGK